LVPAEVGCGTVVPEGLVVGTGDALPVEVADARVVELEPELPAAPPVAEGFPESAEVVTLTVLDAEDDPEEEAVVATEVVTEDPWEVTEPVAEPVRAATDSEDETERLAEPSHFPDDLMDW